MNRSDTPTPEAPEFSPFEARARTLLTQYAEQMPATANTEARVREALTTPNVTSHRHMRWSASHRAGGWVIGAVSVAMVAALLVGFFGVTQLRNNHSGQLKKLTLPHGLIFSGKLKNCYEIPIPTNGGSSPVIPQTCPSDPISIDFSVMQSYADTVRTSFQVRYSVIDAAVSLPGPTGQGPIAPYETSILTATIQDTQGRYYFGGGGSADNTQQSGVLVTTAIMTFSPLPEDLLTSPQTLTLHIAAVEFSYQYADPSNLQQQIQFSGVLGIAKDVAIPVTPHPGRAVMLHVAPQTHSGVTLQPLEFDIGANNNASATAFDQLGSGERLFVRYSGLPADTPLAALVDLGSGYSLPDGSGYSGTADSALLFEGQKPALISIVAPDVDLAQNPVAGPSGTVELEFSFFAPPLLFTSGEQTLTLDNIVAGYHTDRGGGITGPSGYIRGPWTFSIPLS